MRLKKKYLVVLVALMLVMTAVVASFVVSSVQGTRIAYVAISADKESYSMGEDVTFKLRPLTQGIDFTIGGESGDPYRGTYYGEMVTIVRIPDDVDPYSLIDRSGGLNDISMWKSHSPNRASIPIPLFSSSGESLDMSWNGTLRAYDKTGSYIWGEATAGYYLLYPEYYSYGRTVKFFLDHSSIFYYDGLDVDYEITTEGQETTITMSLTLPDYTSPTEGRLSAYVPYDGMQISSPYHNQTLDLKAGETSTVFIKVPSSNPYLSLDAVLVTDAGTYIFGFYTSIHYDSKGGVTYVPVKY